ncbi:methyltransferase family protein [Sphingopyxis chilensis]
MILGFFVIAAGSFLVGAAWKRRYRAEHSQALATDGPYASVRHPLYIGLLTIAFGVLLQCPTLVSLVMFSALVVMYTRLARDEEKEAITAFDGAYRDYMNRVPAFIPDLRQP